MTRSASILLGVAFLGLADAFHLPSGSRVVKSRECDVRRNQKSPLSPRLSNELGKNRKIQIYLLDDEKAGADLAKDMDILDTDLALEIEQALSLAQEALTVEVDSSPEEEEIDEIANMLLEKPPVAPPPMPLPPTEDPPALQEALRKKEAEELQALRKKEAEELAEKQKALRKKEAEELAEKLRKKEAEELAARQEALRKKEAEELAARQEALRKKEAEELAAKQKALRKKEAEELAAKQEALRRKEAEELAARQEAMRKKEAEELAARQEALRKKEARELAEKKKAEEFAKMQETLRKKAVEEIERFTNMIFGAKEELAEVESSTVEVEDVAATIKKEIEESIQEREAMMKKIESEFISEKELLDSQMVIASDELRVVLDQAAQNITDAKSKATRAEKALLSRIDSFKATIDEVTAGTDEINKDKERIQQSKQSMLDRAVQEGKKKLAQAKKSFQFDVDYAKQINAEMVRRAEEAEGKIRDVYEQITRMRTDRVSLQQQIADVEEKALEEIETLQRELSSDDERYAVALQKERDRMDGVIEVAYQAYAIKVCKKIVERKALEADYQNELRAMKIQIAAGREKQEARVKEYLDALEKKHKKERIAIYQEKFEAVSAVRIQMKEELTIENKKMEETHKTMRSKIEDVRQQTARLKSEFEEEMAKKRQLAKKEEKELLGEIEDVRVDMTDKMKTQRRLYQEQKTAYLKDMNAQISDSEVQVRQKWTELAGIKKSYKEVSAKRDDMIDNVAQKQALIDSYESDRESFRKSLRLTARVAREKISTKTRRLLKREKKEDP